MHAALSLLAISDVLLPRGAIEAAVTVEASLEERREWEPVSIAPDLWWGLRDDVTVGVTTSARALSRVEAGQGLCVHACDRLYDNLAVDGRWGFSEAAAARVRLVARSFSPVFRPSVRAGALVEWRFAPAWALVTDPHVQVGLANRDEGNADQVALPVWLGFDLGCRARGWIHTGVRGEIDGFLDKAAIPVGLGGAARVWRDVEIGAEVAFPRLLGPQNEVLARSGYLYVSARR